MFRLNFVLVGLGAFASNAMAATIQVPADQLTIQAGINAASDGDTVLVAAGTYNEAINFIGKAVSVQSSDGPAVTTIDAEGLAASTVTIPYASEGDCLLSGFTVTNGSGSVFTGPSGPGQYCYGGGINCYGANFSTHVHAKIVDCNIVNNTASSKDCRGGGVYAINATLSMRNCSVSGNAATAIPMYPITAGADGGGLHASNSEVQLIDCFITSNTASST